MKLRKYVSLQIVLTVLLIIMLIPKKVSSCCPFKADDNKKKPGISITFEETKPRELKDELLFRY